MVPQLLPPVAPATIGAPAQNAASDSNPAAAACGATPMFTFYFVLSARFLPPTQQGPEALRTFNVKKMRCLQDARAHTHAGRYTPGERSKPDVNPRNGAAWWGRAGRAGSRLGLRADNAPFSKHSGGRASGSGYLKHLAPFISPPWK